MVEISRSKQESQYHESNWAYIDMICLGWIPYRAKVLSFEIIRRVKVEDILFCEEDSSDD